MKVQTKVNSEAINYMNQEHWSACIHDAYSKYKNIDQIDVETRNVDDNQVSILLNIKVKEGFPITVCHSSTDYKKALKGVIQISKQQIESHTS